MRMGPAGSTTTFPLTHFDGDTFSFESIGENANGLAGAIFAPARSPADGTRRHGVERQARFLRSDRAGHLHPRLSPDFVSLP